MKKLIALTLVLLLAIACEQEPPPEPEIEVLQLTLSEISGYDITDITATIVTRNVGVLEVEWMQKAYGKDYPETEIIPVTEDGTISSTIGDKNGHNLTGLYSLTIYNYDTREILAESDSVWCDNVPVFPPDIDFYAEPESGTAPCWITLRITRELPQNGWLTQVTCDFGDGTIITQPYHQYTKAGTYTVTVTGGNELGSDTETKTNYITVY